MPAGQTKVHIADKWKVLLLQCSTKAVSIRAPRGLRGGSHCLVSPSYSKASHLVAQEFEAEKNVNFLALVPSFSLGPFWVLSVQERDGHLDRPRKTKVVPNRSSPGKIGGARGSSTRKTQGLQFLASLNELLDLGGGS